MKKSVEKNLHTTSGFTQAGVYARRQFCADLKVYRPPEPLWNPRLREAATTLAASRGTVSRHDVVCNEQQHNGTTTKKRKM